MARVDLRLCGVRDSGASRCLEPGVFHVSQVGLTCFEISTLRHLPFGAVKT